jgi:transcriptional regulator with XRE-family HTH domain
MAKKGKNSEEVRASMAGIERLKSLRLRMKMTQQSLAKEFYVTAGSISLWENGERSIPGPVRRLIEIYEKILDDRNL